MELHKELIEQAHGVKRHWGFNTSMEEGDGEGEKEEDVLCHFEKNLFQGCPQGLKCLWIIKLWSITDKGFLIPS